MKTILAITLGAILFVGALDNPAHSSEARCQNLGELAEAMLKAKYAGVPVSQSVGVIKQHFPAEAQKAGISLVLIAYGKPNYATEEYQTREIAIFRNDVEMECYRREGN